jgi:hypothetical protein
MCTSFECKVDVAVTYSDLVRNIHHKETLYGAGVLIYPVQLERWVTMSNFSFYDTTDLSACSAEEQVDATLLSITGGSSDKRLYVQLLYDHLGIKQSFSSSPDLSIEDEYIHIKHHLVCLNTEVE